MIIRNIKELIDYKGINKNKFYKQTGLSNGFLDKVKDVGSSKIEQILNTYPDISPEWLLTGKGAMLRGGEAVVYSTGKFREPVMEGGVPLYNKEASAGLVELFADTHTYVPIGQISIPHLPRCDGAIYVHGESMHPVIQSGDIVLYKVMAKEMASFVWGEIYLLDFTHAGESVVTVKHVYKGDGEDFIKLVGANKDDITHSGTDISIKNVRALARVRASVRRYVM